MFTSRILTIAALLVALLAGAIGLGIIYINRAHRPMPEATDDPKSPTEQYANLSLSQSDRELLWQIEHHGNILSQIGFRALTTALVKADTQALTDMMSPDFKGHIPHEPKETAIHTDILDVVRHMDAESPPTVTDRARFVDQLLDFRRVFKGAVKAKLALMKLRPLASDNLQGRWEGTGQLRLWGETEPGKPGEIIVYLKYQVVQPTKEAVAQPAWMTACAVTQRQVARSQHFLMRECAIERGFRPDQLQDNWTVDRQDGATGGVYLCDFDRDGIMDVLVTDISGYYLYKGLGDGKFRNVTAEMGLLRLRPDLNVGSLVACWVDIDGDGWEDLILGSYVYRNDHGKQFVNVTRQCNFRMPPDASGMAIADYDGDGKVDLYVFRAGKGKADSWLTGQSGVERGNQLYHNDGNWHFSDVTEKANASGGKRSTFTALWLDANNDGKPDLYVPNEFGSGVLLINQGNGTFKEHLLTDRPDDFGTMGATCGDINNDGNIDLYCGNMYSKAGTRVIGNLPAGAYPNEITDKFRSFVKGSQLHINRSGKDGVRFEQKGKEWQVNDAGWAYGPALVDLDNDGWLDLYATAGYISRSRSEPDG
jgi:hypothetical protein